MNISNGGTVIADEGIIDLNGSVTVNGVGSSWTNSSDLSINGILEITDGGAVSSNTTSLGYFYDVASSVTVDGIGSTFTNDSDLCIGYIGPGMFNVTGGGAVVCESDAYVGYMYLSPTDGLAANEPDSTWMNNSDFDDPVDLVKVDGVGSKWTNSNNLYVGYERRGTFEITNGGLVRVGGTLNIDCYSNGYSFVNMATGGMLALHGEADGSLLDFLGLVDGSDTINYWDDAIADWIPIIEATSGTDYTLEYLTEGELAGYTVLTVGTAFIPGDANGDGLVDGSDVTILAGNWQFGVNDGQTATWAMGDFNGDGQVDGSDVTILAGNWQYGVEPAATAVPEPGCVALLLMLVLVAGFGHYFSNRNVCRCVSCSSSGKRI